MRWMLMPFARYAEFDGRSRRMEYWMFHLFYWCVLIALFLFGGLIGAFEDNSGYSDYGSSGETGPAFVVIMALYAIFIIGTIIPALALLVRRLHDRDMSGWFILLNLIPYIGGIILLIITLLPGTAGENSYGPDPKEPDLPGQGELEQVFR